MNIEHIMQELGLDPGDSASRKTIEQLMAARPSSQLDDRFVSLLRQDLSDRARRAAIPSQSINYITSFMNKLLASALVVMILVAAGGIYYIQQTDKPLFNFQTNSQTEQLLSGKYGITSVDEESFGELDKVAIVSGGRGGSAATTSTGSDLAQENTKMIAPGEPGSGTSMPPYSGGDVYTFTYEGKALQSMPEAQPVLKRAKPDQPTGLVSRIIRMLSFGLIDLNRFQDVRLQNFSLVEDRDFGYGLNVDLNNGSVNIYQNWEKWPQPTYSCYGYSCGTEPRITIKDIPQDEELITVADDFLSAYAISREGYGKPQVNNQWRIQYEQASDKINFYIPDQISVTYPLELDGQQVYDESGNISGLNVMVDVRTKRVVNLYDLTTKQFEQSKYVAETDTARLIAIAERGGFRNYVYDYPEAKKVQLKLDTPQVAMVKIWYSTDNYKTNNELYVPALVFPIKNWEQTNYWRQNVIVPLVRDILNSDTQQQPPVTIMEGSTAPAVKEPVEATQTNDKRAQ